jgi:hypothetical protein
MTKGFNLQQGDLDALLKEYADAALVHRTASREGKHKIANRAYHRISTVMRELRERGPHALSALLRLLEDERIEVRGWAAAHALEFAPDRAVHVLECIASGPASLEELSAKMVLQQWRHAGSIEGGGSPP